MKSSELEVRTSLPGSEILSEPNWAYKERTFEPAEMLVVNRQRCVNPTLIDNFFLFLRRGSDDVIKQKLNNSMLKKNKGNNCDTLLETMLYPNWAVRDTIISFCENELRGMKVELEQEYGQETSSKPLVAERIDPYAVKDSISQREARFQDFTNLERWVDNQRDIESIIQIRTSSILSDKCGNNRDYIKEFEEFRKAI